jgi:hypothetical protein
MGSDPHHGSFHFILEALPKTGASVLVVEDRIEKLPASLINETNRHEDNRRCASCMTSSQLMPVTRPSSIAWIRSRISQSHAASASGSGAPSALSRRKLAITSLWRGVRSIAAFVISSKAFGMPQCYRRFASGQFASSLSARAMIRGPHESPGFRRKTGS